MTLDIGFQLFSARNFPLDAVLAKVAALGYSHVEGYGGLDYAATDGGLGGLYGDLPGLRRKLDDNGLTMPTAHVGIELLEQPDRAMAIAETLGTRALICPWLHPDHRPTDAGGWRAFGEKLARLAEPFHKAGLTFGYHNHDFEFARHDGRYAMDILLEAAPDIAVEVDVAWIVRGKADPAPWLKANGARIAAIHVKDLAPPGENASEDGWADVGLGVVPWQTLLPLARNSTKAQYFIAEHDNPSDIDRFASRSIAAIKALGA